MPRLLFADMTRDEIGAIAPHAVALLPTAAIEQHGPHNVVGLDTYCCTAVAAAAAEFVSDALPVVVCPPLAYGSSDHHRPWPGVLTLRSGTFAMVLFELLESLRLSGFRHILVLNGHGGNALLIQQMAIDFVLRYHDTHVVAGSYWDVARQALEAVAAPAPVRIPGHGGDFETSLMLFLHRNLVRSDKIAADPPGTPPAMRSRRANVMDRVWADNPGARRTGLSDDATRATADLGRRFFDAAAAEVDRLLRDMRTILPSDE
ncbi:MAG: creatininase family protein [Actinobacteria bacterium]|nr:creatininase family protein [Actinomycetota bacterium]